MRLKEQSWVGLIRLMFTKCDPLSFELWLWWESLHFYVNVWSVMDKLRVLRSIRQNKNRCNWGADGPIILKFRMLGFRQFSFGPEEKKKTSLNSGLCSQINIRTLSLPITHGTFWSSEGNEKKQCSIGFTFLSSRDPRKRWENSPRKSCLLCKGISHNWVSA